MPRNTSGLIPEQRAAIVEDAHRRLAAGASVTRAATEAGADAGVAEATIRRWCKEAGRPLTRASENTAAATLARLRFNAERQRDLVQRGLAEAERALAAIESSKDVDSLELSRVTAAISRLANADTALLLRLGAPPPNRQDEPPTSPSAGSSDNVSEIEAWRRDMRRLAGEDVD